MGEQAKNMNAQSLASRGAMENTPPGQARGNGAVAVGGVDGALQVMLDEHMALERLIHQQDKALDAMQLSWW